MSTAPSRTRACGAPRLGVLGGMGPLATADFLAKLARLTPADRDQDHLSVVACSLPFIPDRTQAILGHGPSPLPAMLEALELLCDSGVDRIAMPCNTAHHWHARLQTASIVPIFHIVDAVAAALSEAGLEGASVGLLATDATCRSGLYEARLCAAGYRLIVPSQVHQERVMAAIRAAKGGRIAVGRSILDEATQALRLAGADAIVLGCTELPLLVDDAGDPAVIDSTAALARTCIRWKLDEDPRASLTDPIDGRARHTAPNAA